MSSSAGGGINPILFSGRLKEKENAAATIRGSLHRYWDDLRTACDVVGELIREEIPNPKAIESAADRVDDIAGRLFSLADRVRGG